MRSQDKDVEKPVTSRRRALKLAGASTALSLGLAGCSGDGGNGGNGKQGNSSKKKVELLFWHTEPEEERKRTIAGISKSFEKTYDDPVTITPQPVDETKINQQVLAGAAAGQLPNVLLPNVQMVQQLGAEGLLSKEAVGNAIDQVGRDKFHKGPLKFMSAGDGGHYAVPHSAFINTFFWRKDIFDKNGLPKPNTWENLRKSATALNKPNQNQYGLGFGTNKGVFTRQCFILFAHSNNASVLDKDGKVVFDSPEMIEALRFHGEMAGYNPPGKHDYDPLSDLYTNSNLYNTVWSSYIMDDILDRGGQKMVDNTQIVPAFSKKSKAVAGFAQGLAILNANNQGINNREVKVASDFAAYLMKPEPYIKFLHLAPGGFRPTISGITDMKKYQNNKVLKSWGDAQNLIDKAINSEAYGQFGIVGNKAFTKFGKAAGKLLVAEACVRVIDGENPETVAKEQAEKIRQAMES